MKTKNIRHFTTSDNKPQEPSSNNATELYDYAQEVAGDAEYGVQYAIDQTDFSKRVLVFFFEVSYLGQCHTHTGLLYNVGMNLEPTLADLPRHYIQGKSYAFQYIMATCVAMIRVQNIEACYPKVGFRFALCSADRDTPKEELYKMKSIYLV